MKEATKRALAAAAAVGVAAVAVTAAPASAAVGWGRPAPLSESGLVPVQAGGEAQWAQGQWDPQRDAADVPPGGPERRQKAIEERQRQQREAEKAERQRQRQAERQAERQREQEAAEAERQRQQREAEKAERQRQRQAERQAERQREQEAAEAERQRQQREAEKAERQRQRQAERQAERQREQEAAEAERQRQQREAEKGERQRQRQAERQAERQREQEAAEAERQRQQREAEKGERQRQRQAERQAERRILRQEQREELAEQNRRAERRAERLRERRRELRAQIEQDRRRADLAERDRRRAERLREWERREREEARRARRETRRDLADWRFFDSRDLVRRDGDVVIYRRNGRPFVVSDRPERFRWHAQSYDVYEVGPRGWTETVVERPNGVRVVTVRDAAGIPIRRYREVPGGRTVTLFNNLPRWWSDGDLVVNVAPPVVTIPRERYIVEPSRASVEEVYETVIAEPVAELDRTYTLNQVLLNERLRDYMPRVDIDTITFATGSALVPEDQIGALETLGVAIEEAVADNPQEVFLIEGHTDAVGSAEYNLELSDRRAEEVATILTEFFEIPPENLVTQGFGEEYLKVATDGPSQANRRVTIRRITPLLSTDDEIAGLDGEGIVE